ncbi:unnamed protein product, partial [Mesorhabditis spiculigera]
VLDAADLQGFRRQLCHELQLTKLEHFEHAKERDLQIKLLEKLGEGTFAVVKRAYWTTPSGEKLDVAVKILRDASDMVMEDLQREIDSLQKLKNPNLIRLYGVVLDAGWMVFELCEGGSLLDRLRDRKKAQLLVSSMLEYSQQITKGMAYLESKKCVHRDLAARNILLSTDERTVKICDFGLMRSLEENQRLYVMNPQKRVAFAWCPPESLRFREFSHASDVWAMGVLMWEIFSLGEDPWAGMRGKEVLEKIDAGERLRKTDYCSEQVYKLMTACWMARPDDRPCFKKFWGQLKQASFPVAEVRDPQLATDRNRLELQMGDRVLIIDDKNTVWFGQNERTRLFGQFPRASVFTRSSHDGTKDGNQRISRPIAEKPPAANPKPSSSSGPGIQLAVLADPFEDVALTRASQRVAPAPIMFQPAPPPLILPASQQIARPAPPPPSTQPKVHQNGAAVPRPKSTSISENGASRSANNTPPMLSADAFVNVRSVAQRLEGIPLAQRPNPPPHGMSSATHFEPNVPSSSRANIGVGHGQSIMNEMQSILDRQSTASEVRLRQNPNETPVMVHSQMNTMRVPSSYPNVAQGPDPFEVRIGNYLANGQKVRPSSHSTSTPQFGTNVLQPTPAISSARQTAAPHMGAVPQAAYQPTAAQLQQLQAAGRLSMYNPGAAAQVQAARPTSQIVVPTQPLQPTPASQPAARLQNAPMGGLQNAQPARQVQAGQQNGPMNGSALAQPADRLQQAPMSGLQNPQPARQVQAGHQTAPMNGSSLPQQPHQAPAQQNTPINTQVLQPSKVAQQPPVNVQQLPKPPSTSILQPSKVDIPPKVEPVKQDAPVKKPEVQKTSAATVRRRTTDDVASFLPEPSALFYGNAGGSVKSGTSETKPTTPASTTPIPTSSAAPVPSTSNPLAPKLAPQPSSQPPQSAPPVAAITPTPMPASVAPAAQAVKPVQKKTAAVLPSVPLVPTPLYPKISSIMVPSEPPKPETRIPQEQVDAILALSSSVSRPQSTSFSVPIFSAQQSLTQQPIGFHGYNTPMMYGGSGGFGGYGGGGSPIYGAYGSTQYPTFNMMSQGIYPSLNQPISMMPMPQTSNYGNYTTNGSDVMAAYFAGMSQSSLPRESQRSSPSGSGSVSRAEQMEILYKEASFTERGNCDRKVAECGGDVEKALKKLKVEHLVDAGIATDHAIAVSALEAKAWDLNAAAEAIFTR